MKATRFNFVRAVMALAAFAVVGFGFTGCQQESDPEYIYVYVGGADKLSKDDALIGKWVDNTKATYEISKEAFKNYGEDYDSYAGNELCVLKTSDTSGYIYIKYTKAYKSLDSAYTTDAPDVGKWYAIHYEELTASTIKIAGAYNAAKKTSTDTLAEAIQEFTVANGYFAWHSECTKQ